MDYLRLKPCFALNQRIINTFLQKSNNILYFVVVIGAVENVEKSFLTKFSTIFWRFFGNFGKNVEKYPLWKTC